MSIVEHSSLSQTPEGGEEVGRVLRLITDGYRLLADLHEAVTLATPEAAQAQQHLAQATRELAAIQHLFERRGRGR